MSNCQPSPSPNCPSGYVWGGLACRREETPQTCSTGYFWDGVKCVEGTETVCAPGYYLSGDVCTECASPEAPSLSVSPGQIQVLFSVATGLSYNVFRSLDGTNFDLVDSGIGVLGAESYNDSDVTSGVLYYYYVSVYLSAGCGFVDGLVGSITAL